MTKSFLDTELYLTKNSPFCYKFPFMEALPVILLFLQPFLLSASAPPAVPLDDILAIYRNDTILLSEMKTLQKTLPIRRRLSPQVYTKHIETIEDLTRLSVKLRLIREVLREQGIVVTKQHVEKQIQSLNTTKEKLFAYLEKNGLSPQEYFLMTGSALEYGIFFDLFIKPYIIVTERDIKNAFYGTYYYREMGHSRYDLIQFIVESPLMDAAAQQGIDRIIKGYLATGTLPKSNPHSNVTASLAKGITDVDLPQPLKFLLRKTDEGAASPVSCAQDECRAFYIIRKNLLNPEPFEKTKSFFIKKLREEAILKLEREWFDDQLAQRDYIQFSL